MRRLPSALLLAAVLIPAVPFADEDHEEARELRKSGTILPLEVILEKLRSQYPGKVIEVKLEDERGRHIYEIELLDERGKVHELDVDARTGAVLSRERE